MGLIKAISGAFGGVMADQWKEYFYCDSIDVNTLVTKGQKRGNGNNRGNENIISNGSVIAVADGQCMIIVDQGKVVEVCAEAGEFRYDASSEPTIFSGSLGTSILDTFKTMGKRFTFGGDIAKDQRVYYFNTKEIVGNKYGTATPIPFRVVESKIGLDIDISVRCNGEYSYKIVNPILFYTNVCGNVQSEYNRSEIDSMLKSELMTALQPAFAEISAMEIRYSSLPGHTQLIADSLNKILSEKWANLRGLEIASFGINSITAPQEDQDMIKQLQRTAMMKDPTMAAATLVSAQAQAMQDAAKNESGMGPMMGFMGMNMANQAGGMNANNLFQMGQQQSAMNQAPMGGQAPAPTPAPAPEAPAQAGWTCSCGNVNTGKFCVECGSPMPAPQVGWTCSCGAVNKGKFCQECGSKKPAEAPLYRCDKCGWEPVDPKNPPKFCPECGDLFDEKDIK